MRDDISAKQLIEILSNPSEFTRVLSTACKIEEHSIEELNDIRMPDESKYILTIKNKDESDVSIYAIGEQSIIEAKHYNSSK